MFQSLPVRATRRRRRGGCSTMSTVRVDGSAAARPLGHVRFRACFADFVKRGDCLLLMACRGALAVALRTRVSAVFPPLPWAVCSAGVSRSENGFANAEDMFVGLPSCSGCTRRTPGTLRYRTPSQLHDACASGKTFREGVVQADKTTPPGRLRRPERATGPAVR